MELEAINLNGNPWTCDCNMAEYKDWQYTDEYKEIENIEELQCYYPRSLRGVELNRMADDALTCEIQVCPETCICSEVGRQASRILSADVKAEWRAQMENKTKYISLFDHDLLTYPRERDVVQAALFIDCSYAALYEFPSLPLGSTYVFMVGNALINLSNNSLSNLTSLEAIVLNNNDISDIGNGSFIDQGFTIKLDLGSNKLTSVNKNYFKGLSNLQELRLDFNSIEMIEDESFDDLPALRILEISSNNVKEIGSKLLSKLINLEYLGMADNYLINGIAPTAFENLGNLWSISIANSYVSVIEKQWLQFNEKLEILDIGENIFTNLSSEFLVSPSLLTLYAESGQIKYIDNEAFSKLPNLQTLRLQDNYIELIKFDAFQINESYSDSGESKLITLDLAYNYMHDIPVDSFWSLMNLQFLRLDNNLFTNLPDASDYAYDYNHEFDAYMPYLTTVYLAYTSISSIPTDSFMTRVYYIETLDISYCQFKDLPYEYLSLTSNLLSLIADGNAVVNITELPQSLSNLQILRLSQTKALESISSQAFRNTPELRTLVLVNGKLNYLPSDVFTPLNKLELLDISENLLTTPNVEWFGSFTNVLEYAQLGRNPWHCYCNAVDYRDWVIHGSGGLTAYTFDVTCETPQNTKSWRISEIEQELIDKECLKLTTDTFTSTSSLIKSESTTGSTKTSPASTQPNTPRFTSIPVQSTELLDTWTSASIYTTSGCPNLTKTIRVHFLLLANILSVVKLL